MAFLIIEKPIEEIIAGLESDVRMLEKAYDLYPEEGLQESINQSKDKLRCAKMYQTILSKRTEYEKFKYLQWKNVEQYIKRCRELVKEIKGVDFDRGSMLFRIRTQIDGKQKYLGAVESPDHATEILQMYVGK